MQELDSYIDKVKNLPPAPTVLPQLLALLGETDIDLGRVVDLIKYDPSLTAEVLKICNSAAVGGGGSAVDDLHQAITRLGFYEVYRVVAAVIGQRTLGGAQNGYGIAAGELWRHSVTTAVAAETIARALGDDPGPAFTAALLHDIGKIILAGALEHIYAKLVEETEQNQSSLLETEKKLLGAQHGELGGRLLARWKFPENLVAAVAFHHDPAAAGPHQRLASFVYLGNMIAHFLGHGYGHQAFALRGRAEALDTLQLKADDLAKFMIKTLENLDAVQSLVAAR